MPRTEHSLRKEVADLSGLLWERGWVANHDGNITAKASPGRLLATPTGVSKRLITADMLLVLDETGKVLRGRYRAFSELGLHLRTYRARTDVGAVVHAHPPYATALAVAGKPLPCFLPEAVVSLGAEVPVVPLTLPGKEAEEALQPFLAGSDGVLLGGHGVLTWGDDPEQAYLRMELIEHLARIAHLRGSISPLPTTMIDPLLAKRRQAGLGPEGRQK